MGRVHLRAGLATDLPSEDRANRAHLICEAEESLRGHNPVEQIDHGGRRKPVEAIGPKGREALAHVAPEERAEVGAGELHVLAPVDAVVVMLHRAEQVAHRLRTKVSGQIFLTHGVVRGSVVAGAPVAGSPLGQLLLQRGLVAEVHLAHLLGHGRVSRLGGSHSDRRDRRNRRRRGERRRNQRRCVDRRDGHRNRSRARSGVARGDRKPPLGGDDADPRGDTEAKQLGLQASGRNEASAVHAQLAHALPDLLEADQNATRLVLPVHRHKRPRRGFTREPVTEALNDPRIARPEPRRLACRRAQRVRAQCICVQTHQVFVQLGHRLGGVLYRERERREVIGQHRRHLGAREHHAVHRARAGPEDDGVAVVDKVGNREGSVLSREGGSNTLEVGVIQGHERLHARI